MYTLAIDSSHYNLWLLNALNVSSTVDELNFRMYLILTNLNGCMWLESTILGSAGLEHWAFN